MNFIKKNIVCIVVISSLALMIFGVFFWNSVADKQTNKKTKVNEEIIDVSEINNVPSVEAKLGSDMKITQGYLLNYTIKKSGIWYMSTAKVKEISLSDKDAIITLFFSDVNNQLMATINKNKLNIEIGDTINFVGTIDLSNGEIELSKISKEEINYKNVTKINFDELVKNIEMVKSNYFIVNGYLVTDGTVYKLYDNKNSYLKNKDFGTYFTISWENDFDYTGNANIKVKCLIGDTYKLKDCEMVG